MISNLMISRVYYLIFASVIKMEEKLFTRAVRVAHTNATKKVVNHMDDGKEEHIFAQNLKTKIELDLDCTWKYHASDLLNAF